MLNGLPRKLDKASTLRRRLSSISVAHKTVGLASPTIDELVRRVWRGTSNQRCHEFTAERGKRPLMTKELRRIVHALGDRVIDDRDRALLTIGFAGGMRRSELVGLDLEDLEDLDQTDDRLVITIRRSKTDSGNSSGGPVCGDAAPCRIAKPGCHWLATAAWPRRRHPGRRLRPSRCPRTRAPTWQVRDRRPHETRARSHRWCQRKDQQPRSRRWVGR